MDIVYDKAKLEDINTIVEMQHKLNVMLGLNEDTDNEYFIDYLQQSISNNDIIYYIAKRDKDVLGVVCVDFSDSLEVGDIDYRASIPLIFVDEKYRNGKIAYDLFKLALKEIQQRNLNAFIVSIEDNNPNKYLHFSIADQFIEERIEQLENGSITKQYILGITNVKELDNWSFKDYIKKVIFTKKNFDSVVQQICNVNNLYGK